MPIKRAILTAAIIAGGISSGIASIAVAAENEEVGTTRWNCRFCVFPEGWRGIVSGGVGYVSEDSAKFGEYSGLDEEGVYPVLGGEGAFYGEDGFRSDIVVRDLGLDTRRIDVSGGRQGLYELRLLYDETVHRVSDSAVTPFRDGGGNNLRLPSGWTRASSTQAMSDLAASLHDVDLGTDRRKAGLGISLRPSDNWSYNLDLRREERTGRLATGVGFITNTAQLAADIDERTNIVDVGARYTADLWQIGLGYQGSFFDNEHDRLVWDNPYSFPGPEEGRASVAPDNQAHRISLSGSYRFGRRAFFAGDVTVGRMRQDEDLLPYTSDPLISVPALPRDSADIEVDTLNANGRLTYRTPLPRLSLVFDYRVDRRDNDSPRDAFTQVVTDSFVGNVRINEPISYARYKTGMQANYRLSGYSRVSGGLDYERFDRDYAGDPVTDEYTLWSQYRTRIADTAQVRFKLSHAERTGDNQDPASTSPSEQNPRMTWFNVADRSRTEMELSLQVTPSERTSLGIGTHLVDDDYDDTQIGRTALLRLGFTADFSARPRDDMTLYAYASHDRYETEQSNSATFDIPNWQGATEDAYVTAGLGGEITGIKGKFDLGLDIMYLDSVGEVDIETGAVQPGFPNLEAERFLIRLRGDYRLRDDLRLGMSLGYESFQSDAWMLDGVNPSTVSGLLALGEESPSYDVVTSILSVEYDF